MDTRFWFNLVVIVSAANGIFSPLHFIVATWSPVWVPFWLPFNMTVVTYGSSLIVATSTLLIGGIPAALYEHIARPKDSDTTSCLIWLAGVIVLSLPAVLTPLQ